MFNLFKTKKSYENISSKVFKEMVSANPNAIINYTTPLDVAIANSCEEAVQLLLVNGAQITTRTAERAHCYVEILEANTIENDIQYPQSKNRNLTHQDTIQKAKRIHATILARIEIVTEQPNNNE